ncbi:J domain-containing protein [Methylomonas koyamae]|uniref:J domain-containing protein n=1 Tax=Methylomonas koyamae TaxID=702114 RepID=UPI00112B9501|nr:J domain-containing protein [Methylomonas koyamae]TPQ24685.1 molecular chaperone DnaJ [Methylomonas koyamae]
MHHNPWPEEEQRWVIWNGSLGIVDTVTIGLIKASPQARYAWLEEPYDMVGPFNLDELETNGWIGFEACTVMSRQKWQDDQVELRRESLKLRRAAQERLYEYQARHNQSRFQAPSQDRRFSERRHREALHLPLDGVLKASQIKTAFRRLAQKTHPDVGGSHEQFIRITEARNALLERAS